MCYLVREQQPDGERRGATLPSGGPQSVRPRWAGALAAALVGGVALAAMVVPKSSPPEASVMQRGAPAAPVSAKASLVPTGTVLEQTTAGIDDGVPGTEMKTAASPCHHGL